MVKKTYNVSENVVKEEISLEVKETGNAPLAEEERTDTPDIDKDLEKKDSTNVKTKIFGTPGKHCYWVIAAVVGLACLTLVLTLALVHGLQDNQVATVSAISEGWKFEGMLRAYPRLEDNPSDASEVVICDKTIPGLVESTKALLNEYDGKSNGSEYQICNPGVEPKDGVACAVDMTRLMANSSCSPENKFGLAGPVNPCFFLRIESSGNWFPEDLSDVTKDEKLKPIFTKENIAVTCASKSQDPIDVKRTGEIKVTPEFGMPKNHFPITGANRSDHESPLVIVHFLNPTMDVDIFVECQVRVKNSKLLQSGGKVGISFRILNDSKEFSGNGSTVANASVPTTENPVQGKNPEVITGVVSSSNETTTEAPPANVTSINQPLPGTVKSTGQDFNQTTPALNQTTPTLNVTSVPSGNSSPVANLNTTAVDFANTTALPAFNVTVA